MYAALHADIILQRPIFVHSRVVEGSWEGIAGCVVHVDVHGECVCWGWMQVAREGMFLLGCSWLRSILYSNRMFLLEKS